MAKVVSLIIKSNPNFARYDLSQNKIGDLGIEAIANVLKQVQTPSIIELNVSTNSLSPTGLCALFDSLHHNQSLIDLNVSTSLREGKNRNRMNKESIQSLADMLQTNKMIQYLDISGMSIAHAGLTALYESLIVDRQQDSQLLSLNLSNAQINTTGAYQMLTKLVLGLRKLMILNLSHNKLGDAGVEQLMSIFGSTKSNKVVTEVGGRVGKSIKEQQREQEASISHIR